MKLKCIILFLSTLFLVGNLKAENSPRRIEQSINQSEEKTITGVVKDKDGEPLYGAHAIIKGLKVGTSTNEKGQFTLKYPAASKRLVLTITYVGMTSKDIVLKDQTHLDIVLEDGLELGEVVVTGIFTKAKESFTGAATMLSKADLEISGNRSLLTSIQNLDPSFNIGQNILQGSDPNKLPGVTMRGASSLPTDIKDMQVNQDSYRASNQPLFILDGFEISLTRFVDLDENLVESVTLLKDANATALYGTRGSNGVVVITTRRPKPGTLRITYRGQLNIENPSLGSYNLMNASEKLDYEKAAGLYTGANIGQAEQLTLDNRYNARRMQVARGVDTYWIKYPVRTGYGQRHSIKIEGGDKTMVYTGGVSFNGIEGTMKGSNRRTIDGNLMLIYTKGSLSVRNDIQISSMKANNSPHGSFDKYAKVNSYYTPYDNEGKLVNHFEKELKYASTGGDPQTVYNPLYNAMLPVKDQDEYLSITNNFGIDWQIIPKLFLRGQIGITTSRKRTDKYIPIGHSDFEKYTEEDNDRKGKYTYGTGKSFSVSAKATANYSEVFNQVHQLSLGAGYQLEESEDEFYTIGAEGFSNSFMDFLGLANMYVKDGKPTATEFLRRNVGLVFNANYTYDRRYFFDVNGTYEGSSQFGSESKFSPVWSVGAGWNLYQEKFMKQQKTVDIARLRVSYGVTGSQAFSPYLAMLTYKSYSSSGYQGWYGMSLMQLGNEDLTWQKTKQVNIGIDLEMLDHRVRLSADVYSKITNNLLADVSLPLSSGFANYKSNIGEVENRGIEIDLNAFILKSRDRKRLTWNVGFKMIHNKNIINKISNSLDKLNTDLASKNHRDPSFLYKEGESINTIFVVESRGIDPSNGQEIFVKLDGTQTYEWDAKDKVACGVAEPKILGNMNTTLRYNGFNLTAYFNYRYGGQYYNGTLANKVENIMPYENADRRAYYDRWKEPGDVKKFKSVLGRGETKATSRFVMDDNSFSCASLNIGYDVPKEWSRKHLHASSVSLKVTLEELFYITSIKQERGTSYPYSKKYSLSLSITF